MSELLDDNHLKAGISDAMRTVKLSINGRPLMEYDRRLLTEAIFKAFQTNGWQVMCNPVANKWGDWQAPVR